MPTRIRDVFFGEDARQWDLQIKKPRIVQKGNGVTRRYGAYICTHVSTPIYGKTREPDDQHVFMHKYVNVALAPICDLYREPLSRACGVVSARFPPHPPPRFHRA